jgi:cellulose synthase/poly-beta-1,6-N-acetylglucosamine synthase-like glycosyltransferase
VLIAARPGQAQVKAVPASQALDYPSEKLQILVARGRQPSVQRNAGIKAATGELIYFLDDDSVPRPQNLRIAIKHFQSPATQMVGGPNICPADAPALEKVFALVLSSWLAFGPSRARYTPLGSLRETSEKELILCNLVARRSALLELGGFNEALYPNEENALMDELQKRGGKLMYDPDLVVARRPRPNMKAFVRMLMTYGRGRAEQFRLHPTFGSAPNFVPPLFLLYVVVTICAFVFAPGLGRLLLLPLILYALIVLAQAAVLAAKAPVLRCISAVPLIVLTHLLYGFGFWRGLFTSLKAPNIGSSVAVELERIENPIAGSVKNGRTGSTR